MKLLIATKNAGKFAEITEVLGVLPIELLSLSDLELKDEVEETGETHEHNAILKAQYFFEKTHLPTLGEDSGIYVDAFPNALGVQTRRWGGLEKATDEEWIKYFLKQMEVIPEKNRGAEFVCFGALILDEKNESKRVPSSSGCSRKSPKIFSGKTRGTITHTLEAPLKPGIPVSSCFKPEGCGKVYAALTPAEKNRVSHRGKAMHALLEFLKNDIL